MRLIVLFFCVGGSAERIDEIRDEIFLFGAGADGLFFVFYDDFVVGEFNNLGARDGELGVEEAFD